MTSGQCAAWEDEMIEITLTSYNMGELATEEDYGAWASFVAEHIGAALDIEVGWFGLHPFGRGPDRDTIAGATHKQEEAIRSWLKHAGWERFCAEQGRK